MKTIINFFTNWYFRRIFLKTYYKMLDKSEDAECAATKAYVAVVTMRTKLFKPFHDWLSVGSLEQRDK